MKPEKTDNLKKKDQQTSYTTKSTRGTVIIQSDISHPPPFWKPIYLSLEMSEQEISLRVYLQMMYFLSVKFQENLLNSLIGMGKSSGGCRGFPDPLLLPIIGISLARSNLHEIAVKS